MKKLLIVVDFQNDNVAGSLGFPGAKDIEESILKRIKHYRSKGDQVIFTLDTHFDDAHEKWVAFHNKDYSVRWGWELYGKIKDLVTDDMLFISKHTYGATDLFNYLLKNKFDHIEFAGVMTNVCIISNVILAQNASPEAQIIVDEACVASSNYELHKKALDIMESLKVQIIRKKRREEKGCGYLN